MIHTIEDETTNLEWKWERDRFWLFGFVQSELGWEADEDDMSYGLWTSSWCLFLVPAVVGAARISTRARLRKVACWRLLNMLEKGCLVLGSRRFTLGLCGHVEGGRGPRADTDRISPQHFTTRRFDARMINDESNSNCSLPLP